MVINSIIRIENFTNYHTPVAGVTPHHEHQPGVKMLSYSFNLELNFWSVIHRLGYSSD